MINKGTVLLETDRLILRKFKYSDAEYMFKNWGSDPKVSKFLSWPTHSDVNVSQNIIFFMYVTNLIHTQQKEHYT